MVFSSQEISEEIPTGTLQGGPHGPPAAWAPPPVRILRHSGSPEDHPILPGGCPRGGGGAPRSGTEQGKFLYGLKERHPGGRLYWVNRIRKPQPTEILLTLLK